MPVIPFMSRRNKNLTKRLVTSENGDIDVPRLLGIIFVIIVFLIILYFGGRSVSARRKRQMYNTARNRGPVRVQRLERSSGHTSRGSGSGGNELPPWRQSVNRRDPVENTDDGVAAPPPVYVKDQEGATMHRDPPPPYVGRDGPS